MGRDEQVRASVEGWEWGGEVRGDTLHKVLVALAEGEGGGGKEGLMRMLKKGRREGGEEPQAGGEGRHGRKGGRIFVIKIENAKAKSQGKMQEVRRE